MTETLAAQVIDVGPVRVDTGNDWLDFGFAVAFLLIMVVAFRKWRGGAAA